MRRVAREVGVEAMSLYNHVRDKEDLLDGVVDRIMAGFRFPDATSTDEPREYGRAIALEWRAQLKAHPNVVALFAHQHKPMRSLESLRPMEVALQTLRDMGLSVEYAFRAFQVIGGYIMGYVMMETGEIFTPGDDDAGAFARSLPADDLPCIAATLPFMADCDVDAQFEFGLDLMLDGLVARSARGRA
jgi:AcrR family transcriptional regulator